MTSFINRVTYVILEILYVVRALDLAEFVSCGLQGYCDIEIKPVVASLFALFAARLLTSSYNPGLMRNTCIPDSAFI